MLLQRDSRLKCVYLSLVMIEFLTYFPVLINRLPLFHNCWTSKCFYLRFNSIAKDRNAKNLLTDHLNTQMEIIIMIILFIHRTSRL